MLNGVRKNEVIIATALVVGASAVIGGWFYYGMKPGRGLKISAPNLSTINNGNPAAPVNYLDQVSSASFMAAMGLEVIPKKTVEVAAATETASTPIAIASITMPVAKPEQTDLDALGYRLRGIVLEDGRSAAFVFVPAEKRVVLIREKASGTIRLLEASMRSVILKTPEGTGFLNLESARQAPGTTNLSPSGILDGSSPTAAPELQEVKPGMSEQKKDRQSSSQSGPGAIAGSINQGQLKLSQQRGKYSVEIREIPELLKGYELKPGDKIFGTDSGEFGKPQDIAINLGTAGERARNLLIQRDGKVMTIKAPPPPVKQPTSPANPPTDQAIDPAHNPAPVNGTEPSAKPPANPAINPAMPAGANPLPGNNPPGSPTPGKP